MVLPFITRERVRIFGKLTISGESMVLPTDESCSDDVVCCRMLNLSVNRPQLLIPSRCPHSVPNSNDALRFWLTQTCGWD